MNEIIQSLLERKSVRAYTDQEISEENVQLILNAAMQAPTAGNQQLYTILRITDPEKKHRLSISCDNQPFIEQAGLVLVFCADCLKWLQAYQAAGAHPRKPGAGDLFIAFSDANIAAQNAVTAAQSLGIGSCYIGDIMENIEKPSGKSWICRSMFSPPPWSSLDIRRRSRWKEPSRNGCLPVLLCRRTPTISTAKVSCGRCLPEKRR